MKTATKKTPVCSRCDEPLAGEELGSPAIEDGEIYCDECHHECFEFTCCCCCNYGHVKDQHNLLVVFEECASQGGPSRTVAPGIYKIAEEGRYHGGPLIGEHYLFGDHLERIADVNPDMDGDSYPCGHLCAECQGHVLAQFAGKCAECKQQKPSCLRVRVGRWADKTAKKWIIDRPKVLCAECRHKVHSWKLVER